MSTGAGDGNGRPAPGPSCVAPTSSSAISSAPLQLGKDNTGVIALVCSTSGELKVERELLCSHSKFFSDMLASCETTQIRIDESLSDMTLFMDVVKGNAPPSTFDTRSSACWDVFKRVLDIADKYDCPLVRERSEKWLVSRCLRGRVRCTDFKFQDVQLGMEWLVLSQRHGLRDLGWYVAYDLGLQLAEGGWPNASSFLKDVCDPDFLKVMLEAVADSVRRSTGLERGSHTEYEEAE